MTAAARLALAGIVGAGVRLSAAEVAQLLAAFPKLRRVGEDDLDAASDAKVAAAAERRAARPGRRLPQSPEPALPVLPVVPAQPQLFPFDPVIHVVSPEFVQVLAPAQPAQIPEDGPYSMLIDGTLEKVIFPVTEAAADTGEAPAAGEGAP